MVASRSMRLSETPGRRSCRGVAAVCANRARKASVAGLWIRLTKSYSTNQNASSQHRSEGIERYGRNVIERVQGDAGSTRWINVCWAGKRQIACGWHGCTHLRRVAKLCNDLNHLVDSVHASKHHNLAQTLAHDGPNRPYISTANTNDTASKSVARQAELKWIQE
jgi:hypothetical protein